MSSSRNPRFLQGSWTQSVSTIVLASLTILYSLWEKKGETTKQEIRREMAIALDILDEIGQTYGPTRKLHQTLASLVAATIENLERSRNGVKVQGATLGSPTKSREPPPMQLPMRIDPNLRIDPLGITRRLASYRADDIPQSTAIHPASHRPTTPIPPRPWQDPLVPDSHASPFFDSSSTQNGSDPARGLPTAEVLDNSMVWGPSLEWAGGWDDFLNAIAM